MAGFPDCDAVVRTDPEGLRNPGGERRLRLQNGRSRSTEFSNGCVREDRAHAGQ